MMNSQCRRGNRGTKATGQYDWRLPDAW